MTARVSRLTLFAMVASMVVTVSGRQEPVDRATIDRLRAEGTERSRVAAFFDHLVTVIGPRLTGSPAHKASAEWARQQLESAGLKDSHLEPWEFGQGQDNVAATFDAWLEPFKAMGARRNVQERTGNTDHLSFTALGLPGFNPVQDYADYDVRTHTNMDTAERVGEADMKQAAIVFASFAWHAAMRDAKIPRPPDPPAR